jgi:epoxyqueuosine reductase QueG
LAGAITEKGHDKVRCRQYQSEIGYFPEALKKGYDNDTSIAGCGLCQTRVPCEFKAPEGRR